MSVLLRVKSWLLTRWGLTGIRVVVAKLKADPSFSTEAERVREFIQQESGCRATYYNHAKRLGQPLEFPDIRLHNRPPDRKLADARLLELLRRRFGILGNDEPL